MRQYLRKILAAPFQEEPFEHLYIQDFLDHDDFREMQTCPRNRLPRYSDTRQLIDGLRANHYSPIAFPGCVEDVGAYIEAYESGRFDSRDPEHQHVVESYGMAFLQNVSTNPSPRIRDLLGFLNSDAFHQVLRHKFGIVERPTRLSSTVQKYLSGYEISPHPDIKPKALTFLLNINPYDEMEAEDLHTHLLKFLPEYDYVKRYWAEGYCERDWVPWTWCQTVSRAVHNNALLVFRPNDDTLHAVRLNYDHLKWQRTQVYGNLWYTDAPPRQPKVPYWQIPRETT